MNNVRPIQGSGTNKQGYDAENPDQTNHFLLFQEIKQTVKK